MKKIFLLAFLALSMIRALAQPSTAATPPIANAGTVMSLFGSHYTADPRAAGAGGPIATWRQNWGGATAISYSNIGGNDTTIQYSNFDYAGIQFSSALDISAYDSIHFDIWSPTSDVVNFHLIWGGESGPNITLNAGSWTSVTLPLDATNFPGINLNNIIQMKFSGVPQTGASTFYLENVYLNQTVGKPTITGFSIPAQNVGATYTITDPTSNSIGAFTYSSSNNAIATVSGNTITCVGGGTCTITATQAADPTNGYLTGTATASLVVSFDVPSIAAPVPTTDPSYVKSLWGDTYTNVSGINWNAFNGGTAFTTPTIGGKSTILYSGIGYIGSQLASDLDVTGYDSIHLDIWSPNVTSLTIGLISLTGGTKEVHATVSLSVAGWNYISIPLTSFSAVDLSKFRQMIIIGTTPSTGGVVYFQNVYFVNAVGKPTLSGFSNIPTQVIGVNSTYTINATSNSTGAITYSSSNSAVATISGNVITIVGAGTSTITATEAADLNYTAATFTTTLTVNYAGPTTSAPVPTNAALYSKSLWGDTYTNVSGINWNAFNGGTQFTTPTVGGKSTIEYAGLGYIGNQLGSDLDVSNFDSIHLDIWSPNVTSLTIGLISLTGGTKEIHVTVPLTVAGWNYVSIPLTSYSGVDLSKFRQMIFIGVTPGSGGIVYLQNIYFINVPGKPTITGFSIPTQILGTSTYTITNPTTNSTGAFTYTSSNSAVATISGRTITIKGVGTSTITATEASDNNYSQGVVTTTLTVDYPGPTTAAAVPTASSGNVKSLWGDTYTNVSGTNWSPYWGQPAPGVSTSTVSVGGKTTLKYSNMAYEGVEFASNIDASTKNMLHMDIWTPNITKINIDLIGVSGPDYTATLTQNGWNSINIPLSNYTGGLNAIPQFKFDITPYTPNSGGVIYLQNIYFVNATPTWTGATSTDFSLASNWLYGLMPSSVNNTVSIPAAVARQPILSANTSLAGMVLNGTLGLNGKTLTLTGAVSGTGSLSGSTTSSLVVAGSVGTLNFTSGANSVQNLTVTSGSVTLGNALNVYGTFTPTAGTITTGGNLTLKSTSITNSAVVGVVGGTVSGTATVERFIPAGLRTYRDLGAEVANAGTIFNNWQEAGVNTNGYGIQITGAQGSSAGTDGSTGFDYSLTGNHSLFTYLNNTWDSVLTTKGTTLSPYQGFRVLVRGNRSNDLQVTQPYGGGATIRAKGNLVTGDVSFSNLTSGGNNYSFVANPYVSVVDWEAVAAGSQNINTSYWYCDPTFQDTLVVNGVKNTYTTFVSYNQATHTLSDVFSKSNAGRYIMPGQAFFVQNAASGTPSLNFKESYKANAQTQAGVFGTAAVNRIAVGLSRGATHLDGAVVVFGNFSKTIGTEDAAKFPNSGENVAFKQGTADLCINGTSMPLATDAYPLHLYNLQASTSYSIRLDASQFVSNGLAAYLKDNTSNTQTLITGDNTLVNFTTNATNASSYSNRYSIVFGAGALPVKSIEVTAASAAKGVLVKWSVKGEDKVASYAIEQSSNGVVFNTLSSVKAGTTSYSYTDAAAKEGNNYYRIKVINNAGSVSYSEVVVVTVGKAKGTIGVYPNPVVGNNLHLQLNNLEAGNYSLQVINKLGKQVFATHISPVGGSSTESVATSNLATGTYTLKLTHSNGATYQTQIEVK